MKILIADFEIAKYGGIVEHVSAKARAFKALGHEVDLAQFTVAATTRKKYDAKIRQIQSGEFQDKLKLNSQNGGYEFDEATGYYKNNYYGFFLPPGNRIGVYEPDALEQWRELTKDVDLIMWNFAPTKTNAWTKKDRAFDFWWKFFDLPSDIAQMFVVHDAYFDERASNISALRDKIWFLECAHLAAYRCCENFSIPRALLLNPRYIPEGSTMPEKSIGERTITCYAAHIFKSMKHIEDYIRAIPYMQEIRNDGGEDYFGKQFWLAGSGIEQAYMVAEEKVKPTYLCNYKKDPDMPSDWEGLKIWDVAEAFGMDYLGQMCGEMVRETLMNTRFAVDPSWSDHYAKYCRTHINGFIIEAILCGAYPVIRDYAGLQKGELPDDPLFEALHAVVIPHDATPKEFANLIKIADETMDEETYRAHTQANYELVCSLFNSVDNCRAVINLVKKGREGINRELECGEDSDRVKTVTEDIMTNLYGIDLPIPWETD